MLGAVVTRGKSLVGAARCPAGHVPRKWAHALAGGKDHSTERGQGGAANASLIFRSCPLEGHLAAAAAGQQTWRDSAEAAARGSPPAADERALTWPHIECGALQPAILSRGANRETGAHRAQLANALA